MKTATIGKNDVLQRGPFATRKKERLNEALSHLIELDRVRTGYEGRRVMLKINPALLKGFGNSEDYEK